MGRFSVMVSIVLAMLVSSMDTTITNTTMPIIVKELGGYKLYAWSFASYMIVSTVLVPIAGRLSDLFGRKKIFALGLVLFLFGSWFCGMANSMPQLILFRAIQGIGGGVMMSFPAIIAGDLFSIEKRGIIQAFFSAMWGLSSVLAPLLGAWFVEYLSWRWIFYVNIPICLLSVLLLLPYKDVYQAKRASVDYIGAVLLMAGVSMLLLTTVVTSLDTILLSFICGTLILILFFFYEKRLTSPILPFDLFRNPPVFWMILNVFLVYASLFGASNYLPLFLQQKGYTLFTSGLPLFTMSIGWMCAAVPAGKWIIRYGYRPLLIIGNVLNVLSCILYLLIHPETSFEYILFTLFLSGLAFGIVTTITIIGSQQLVGTHQKGVSTSLQRFASNIGGVIGITLMGAILTNSANVFTGFHHLFWYGLGVSIIAFITSFFLKVPKHHSA